MRILITQKMVNYTKQHFRQYGITAQKYRDKIDNVIWNMTDVVMATSLIVSNTENTFQSENRTF